MATWVWPGPGASSSRAVGGRPKRRGRAFLNQGCAPVRRNGAAFGIRWSRLRPPTDACGRDAANEVAATLADQSRSGLPTRFSLWRFRPSMGQSLLSVYDVEVTRL